VKLKYNPNTGRLYALEQDTAGARLVAQFEGDFSYLEPARSEDQQLLIDVVMRYNTYDALIKALCAAYVSLDDVERQVSPGTDDVVLAAIIEDAGGALRTVREALKTAGVEP
jgi:hypothetical protein